MMVLLSKKCSFVLAFWFHCDGQTTNYVQTMPDYGDLKKTTFKVQ